MTTFDDQLKVKLSDVYGLPTSFMERPPLAFSERIHTIFQILSQYPPPHDAHAYVLVNAPQQNRSLWMRLKSPFTIGNHQDNDLKFNDLYISVRHAQINRSEGRWQLIDLQSTNGVYVNQHKVTEKQLHDGDIIQIGDVLMLFIGDGDLIDF